MLYNLTLWIQIVGNYVKSIEVDYYYNSYLNKDKIALEMVTL